MLYIAEAYMVTTPKNALFEMHLTCSSPADPLEEV
jgi:hypothetical protein